MSSSPPASHHLDLIEEPQVVCLLLSVDGAAEAYVSSLFLPCCAELAPPLIRQTSIWTKSSQCSVPVNCFPPVNEVL